MVRTSIRSFDVWQWQQPGAFLEYTVRAPRDGSYTGAPMFNAPVAGATAVAFVDDVPCGRSRLAIRHPSRIDGEVCARPSLYKGIVITGVP